MISNILEAAKEKIEAIDKYLTEENQRISLIGNEIERARAISILHKEVNKRFKAIPGNEKEKSLYKKSSIEAENKKLIRANQADIKRDSAAKVGTFGFKDDDNRVIYYGEKEIIDVSSLINITAKHVDLYSSGNSGLTLEFENIHGQHQKWSMPRSMLSDERLIKSQLCSMGAQIYNDKKFIDYLMRSNPEKSLFCVDRIGWHTYKNEKFFVLPHITIGNNNENKEIIYQSEEINTPFKILGTVEQWREAISKPLSGNSRPIAAICHAFGALLIGLNGGKNSGRNFFGPSSIGKTTIAQVCASIFGDSSYLSTCRTTDNALEESARSRHDCLLPLDELGQMPSEKVGEACYLFGNGIGKSRSQSKGGLRKPITFRGNFLITSEYPIAHHMRLANQVETVGQEVRILDIPAQVGKLGVFDKIPKSFTSGAAFSNYLQSQCELLYGSPLIAFLKELIKPDTLNSIPKLIKAALESLKQNLPKNAGQASRALDSCAYDIVAGELASKWRITGWQDGEATKAVIECFKAWVVHRGGLENQEGKKLLRQVRAFIETHHARFKTIGSVELYEKDNLLGFKERKGDRWVYYVFATAFEEMTKNFNKAFSIEFLLEVDWITTKENKKGIKETLRQKCDDGMKPRCYWFDGPKWNQVEDDEE